jgi:hypothetical protein
MRWQTANLLIVLLGIGVRWEKRLLVLRVSTAPQQGMMLLQIAKIALLVHIDLSKMNLVQPLQPPKVNVFASMVVRGSRRMERCCRIVELMVHLVLIGFRHAQMRGRV